MARHSQRGSKSSQPPFVCTHCKRLDCGNCVDIVRIAVGMGTICNCTRKQHSGEPVLQQVMDPESGDVYAPDLVVVKDGEVQYMDHKEISRDDD